MMDANHCRMILTLTLLPTVLNLPPLRAHDLDGVGVFLSIVAVTEGQSQVQIREEDGYRFIQSNGLPDHVTGRFPNRNNPNRIEAQTYQFRVPLFPQANRDATAVGMNLFGVALNGVPFDAAAAEFWRGDRRWQYEALSGAVNLGLDDSNAHVQPNGAYHYHGLPTALVRRLTRPDSMILIGYAADGFPVYAMFGHSDPLDPDSSLRKMKSGYRLRTGTRPDGPGGAYDGSFVQDYEFAGDDNTLDECNGRFGVTPEFREGVYHYFVTDTFPFIPRQLKGTMDPSFRKGPPNGQNGPPPGRGRRPPGPAPGFPPPPR